MGSSGGLSTNLPGMPPGRPREFDTERALDDAMALFWRRGYRGTTTRELESAIGVSPSSLYRAFGSKAGLMEAVLHRYRDLMEGELLGPLADGGGGLADVDRFLARLGDWLAADGGRGCLIGRMLSEGPPADDEVARGLADYRGRLRGAMTAALGRAARTGEIDPGTVATRTEVLVTMVLGLNLATQGGYGPDARAALVAAVRDEVGRWADEGVGVTR